MTAGTVCPRCGGDLQRVLKVEHGINLLTVDGEDQRNDLGTSSRMIRPMTMPIGMAWRQEWRMAMGRVVKMITVEITPDCVKQDKPAKLDDWYRNVAKPIESGLDTLDIGHERTKLEWRFKKPIKLYTARSLHCGMGAFIASRVNLLPLDESL